MQTQILNLADLHLFSQGQKNMKMKPVRAFAEIDVSER